MKTSSQTINYSSDDDDDDDVPFDLLLIIYYHFLRRCIINIIILCVVYFLCHIKSAVYIIKENISPVFSSSAIYSIKYTLSPTSSYFHRFKITTVSSSSCCPYQDSISYYTTTTVAALIIAAAAAANHLYPSCGCQCLKAIDKHILHNSLFNSDLYCHSLLWSPTNNRPERISVIYI